MPRDDERTTTDERYGDSDVLSTPDHRPPSPTGDTLPSSRRDESLDTSETVAVVAALVPGLGQMLLGQTVKGLVLLGVSILLGCMGGILSVASVIDAFLVAKAKKRRPVDEWEFFPEFKRTFDL